MKILLSLLSMLVGWSCFGAAIGSYTVTVLQDTNLVVGLLTSGATQSPILIPATNWLSTTNPFARGTLTTEAFTNAGVANNGGGVTNFSAVVNRSTLENQGAVTNAGAVTVAGGMTNFAAVEYRSTETNAGAVTFAGGVTNFGAGQFQGQQEFTGNQTNRSGLNVKGGLTNWIGGIRITPKTVGTSFHRVGGTFTNNIDSVAFTNLNAAGTLTNLAVVSIPGSVLSDNGDSLEAEWYGVFANAKTTTNRFVIVCGSSTLLDTGSQVKSNDTWRATTRIDKTSSGLHCYSRLFWGAGNGAPFAETNFDADITDNNSSTLSLALQCASTMNVPSAITNKSFIAKYFPTAP